MKEGTAAGGGGAGGGIVVDSEVSNTVSRVSRVSTRVVKSFVLCKVA